MEYNIFTITTTGRLIACGKTGFLEWDGSSFGPVKGKLSFNELDTRVEARDFNDFASALKFWKSLSDSNK